MSRLDAAKRWAHAAKSHYERDLHRVGITGLHKAAMGDVLEGVAHVTELVARVEELAGALRDGPCSNVSCGDEFCIVARAALSALGEAP